MKVDERPAIIRNLSQAMILALLLAGLMSVHQAIAQDQSNDPLEATTRIEPRQIIIKTGDTLQSVSLREYGTVGLWRHIAEFNRLAINAPLVAGQVVLLPELRSGPREFAEIAYAHGSNQLISKGTDAPKPLKRNDRIYLRDVIETSPLGFVSIAFRSGTVINLQPGSRVQLTALDCLDTAETCFIDIFAERGAMSSDVKRKEKQSNSFTITTPHASAAVRGTVLDFQASDEQMLVGVTEGSVEVSAQNQSVAVPVGYAVQSIPGEPPGDLIELLPPPSFISVPPRLAQADHMSVWPIPLASHYLWSITADSAGSQVVSSDTTESPVLTVSDISPGEYYLNIRAADELGNKGFTASDKILIAELDPVDLDLRLNATRDGRSLNINVIDPKNEIDGYEIQLADTAEFDNVVSVDIGSSGKVIFSSLENPVFLRARALYSPNKVSPFGPTLQAN